MEKNYQKDIINKGFNKISDFASLALFKFITTDLNQAFNKKDFLKFDFE